MTQLVKITDNPQCFAKCLILCVRVKNLFDRKRICSKFCFLTNTQKHILNIKMKILISREYKDKCIVTLLIMFLLNMFRIGTLKHCKPHIMTFCYKITNCKSAVDTICIVKSTIQIYMPCLDNHTIYIWLYLKCVSSGKLAIFIN